MISYNRIRRAARRLAIQVVVSVPAGDLPNPFTIVFVGAVVLTVAVRLRMQHRRAAARRAAAVVDPAKIIR